MATYHNGKDGLFKVGTNQIPTDKWSVKLDANLQDVSNSKDGRLMIPGLENAEGTFSFTWDSATEYTATGGANIRHGVSGTFNFTLDGASQVLSVPGIISDTSFSMDINGKIEVSGSFKQSGGSITYPT